MEFLFPYSLVILLGNLDTFKGGDPDLILNSKEGFLDMDYKIIFFT